MKRAALMFAGFAMVASAAYSGEGNVRRAERRIPGRYVVVLEMSADASTVADSVRNLNGAKVRHAYGKGVKGLAVEMSDADAQALARDPRVKFIEEDAVVNASSAPWALDRIDQRGLPLDGSYTSDGTGAGVTVYVVDTGILGDHSDFGGRVLPGFNAVGDEAGTTDCNGHGTHVAGLIAGTAFGVAKSATLVPIRALDCKGGGSLSGILAGLEWILNDYAATPKRAIVNMSLGGSASSALDNAVEQLVAAGMTAVVAAGNNNVDACTTSPARVGAALTVGATTEADQRASFSNYGRCVDLFAPGQNILSDSIASTTATSVSSGTSASAPIVAGVAAVLLERFPTATPQLISQTVALSATLDVLGGLGEGSPNRLLFSHISALDTSELPDAQLLADPSFEYGTTFWTAEICDLANPVACPPSLDVDFSVGQGPDFNLMSAGSRSGTKRAVVGGKSTGGKAKTFHLSSETVTIPSYVRRAEFSVWVWVYTKNKKSVANDVLTIEVLDANGVLLDTLGSVSNVDASTTYVQRRFDLSRFRGRNVRVSFTGTETQGLPTWFLLDDATLNVWR